jgi:hypothetical protein
MKRFPLILVLLLLLAIAIAVTAAAQDNNEPLAVSPPRLAVAHLAPFAGDPGTAVTVTLDATPVLTNFAYGDSTEYLELTAGTYLVEIFPEGSTTAAISGTVTLADGTDYTAIATGDGVNQPLELQALVDDNTPPAGGNAKLRLGHLAPFASGDALADIRLQDGTVVLANVAYTATAYQELPAGTYDLKITTPGGDTTLIDPLPVTLSDGDIVSAFATGDGSNQPLGAFALPSGQKGDFLPLASYLQVAHLAPFAADSGTAVTVTLDATPVLTNFEYGDSTGYLTVTAGSHLVEIFPGGSATAAISGTVDLMQAQDYTAIAIGNGGNQPLELLALLDDNTPPDPGESRLRLGHLAPFATGDALADVRLQDGTPLLTDVAYTTILTTYFGLPAGTYDLKITTPGGDTTLIDPLPVTLNDGDILSAFATGDGGNQPLGVFALPSGQPGFFLDLAARLQVAHLAPFAMDPGTAVTVTLDATPVLTNFEYGDSTEYLWVPPASYLVEIFPGGSATAAISDTVDLQANTDYTAIAIGDGVNQPLELLALVDDNTPPAPGYFKLRLGHLAPFASGDALADIRLQDGTPVLTDVAYADISTYLPLPAGTYDLKITTPGGDTTLIDPLPVTLGDGDILSAFATGEGTNQKLAVFALPSGQIGFMLPDRYMYFFPIIVRNAAP